MKRFLPKFSLISILVILCFTINQAQQDSVFDYTKDPELLKAINDAMDSPVSELFVLWNQFDWIQVTFPQPANKLNPFKPNTRRAEWVSVYSLIPTFPIPLGSVNWVSRIALQFPTIPLKEELGKLFNVTPGGGAIIGDTSLVNTIRDPYGKTSGFGDMLYIGLFGPKSTFKLENASIIWAVGPTIMMPTASKDILGTGKWSAGPALVLMYSGSNWKYGFFLQQWWSFAGDDNRADVNMTNTQYFIYYSPHPDWAFGMSPNFTVNWNAAPENQMTFPIGFGFNKTFYFGELPVAIGAEWYYAIASPEYAPASRHSFRLYVMPVFPAPWSDLAKLLREKMP